MPGNAQVRAVERCALRHSRALCTYARTAVQLQRTHSQHSVRSVFHSGTVSAPRDTRAQRAIRRRVHRKSASIDSK
eukprot:14000221-Alexandrium_andersonii.AAC.1